MSDVGFATRCLLAVLHPKILMTNVDINLATSIALSDALRLLKRGLIAHGIQHIGTSPLQDASNNVLCPWLKK
jgi:hypothetical protein